MAEVLGLTASIIAVLQMTSSVISVCYDYQAAVKGAPWELSQIKMELESLRNILHELEPRAKQAELAESISGASTQALSLLCGPLQQCLQVIKELETQLKTPSWSDGYGPKRKALIQALRWPLKESDTRKALENIGRFKATLSLAISADQATLTLEVQKLSIVTQQELGLVKQTATDLREDVETTKVTTLDVQKQFQLAQSDLRRRSIHEWLSAPDPSTNLHHAQKNRETNTGSWFTTGDTFTLWKNKRSLLWLHGKPGCGKTVLSSTVVHEVRQDCRLGNKTAVAFFYFDFNDADKQKSESMIRSLITQLSEQRLDRSQELDDLYSACYDGKRQPDTDSLMKVLEKSAEEMDRTYIILDALDECSDTRELLNRIEEIQKWEHIQLHVLLTSRRHSDIEEAVELFTEPEQRISIQNAPVNADISTYVHARLQKDSRLKRWRTSPQVREEIKATLIEKADGM